MDWTGGRSTALRSAVRGCNAHPAGVIGAGLAWRAAAGGDAALTLRPGRRSSVRSAIRAAGMPEHRDQRRRQRAGRTAAGGSSAARAATPWRRRVRRSPSKRRSAAAIAASRARRPRRRRLGQQRGIVVGQASSRPHSGMSPPRRREWPPPTGRSATATRPYSPERRQRPGALGGADQLDELGAVAELVLAARRGGDPAARRRRSASRCSCRRAAARRRPATPVAKRASCGASAKRRELRTRRSIGVEISRLVSDLGSL